MRFGFAQPKQILEIFRLLCAGKTEPHTKLCNLFDENTKNGADMMIVEFSKMETVKRKVSGILITASSLFTIARHAGMIFNVSRSWTVPDACLGQDRLSTMKRMPALAVWEFNDVTPKGASVIRTYLWLKNHDYVVILERQPKDKGDVFMLITSFYLDHEAKRRDLQSRYERRRK